jgi:hypothetical protein
VKDLIKKPLSKILVEHLEEAPDSRCRRTAIEEELTASGGEQDAELVATDCLDPVGDPSPSNLM